MTPSRTVDVCAAVVMRGRRFLLATRPDGTHLAGQWEFPGGKVHAGETLAACIVRELEEELGVTVSGPAEIAVVEHEYPEKRIRLHFMRCTLAESAELKPQDGQQAGWFTPEEMAGLELAGADREFVRSQKAEGLEGLIKLPCRIEVAPRCEQATHPVTGQ